MTKIIKFEELLDKNLNLTQEALDRLVYNILVSNGMKPSENRLTLMVNRARQKVVGAMLVLAAVNMAAAIQFDQKRGDLIFSNRSPEEALLLLNELLREDDNG